MKGTADFLSPSATSSASPCWRTSAVLEAAHQAHVATEVIAGELQGNQDLAAATFNARVIPGVVYTDTEVAWVGLTENQAKAQGIKVKKGLIPWNVSGRAIANGRDEGVTQQLFDDSPEAHCRHRGGRQPTGEQADVGGPGWACVGMSRNGSFAT